MQGNEAFVRSAAGALATFAAPAPAADVFIVANALNAKGVATGYTYTRTCGAPGTACSDGGYRSFVRRANGTLVFFDAPRRDADAQTLAQAINGDGTVVGWTFAADTPARGFVRSALGRITLFGVPDAGFTYPLAINDAGVIGGLARSASGPTAGFLRLP